MNKEIKEKWVAALRSGEYKQGTGALNQNGKMCCLGVLCDIYGKEKNIPWDPRTKGSAGNNFMKEDTYLPNEVVDWSGLYRKNPFSGAVRLAEANDSGVPFADIANLIELGL